MKFKDRTKLRHIFIMNEIFFVLFKLSKSTIAAEISQMIQINYTLPMAVKFRVYRVYTVKFFNLSSLNLSRF